MGLLEGKKGIIMGVANDHSIAWGIAKKLSEQGADLCFTYQGETLLRRIQPLACLLYTSPSPRDMRRSRMPSSA